VLLELYETAKHSIQGGYIVRHVQDQTYPQEARTRHSAGWRVATHRHAPHSTATHRVALPRSTTA
jgi:hypothetical protein